MIINNNDLLHFNYTNWIGENETRHIKMLNIAWDSSQWHPETQWLMRGYDYIKQAERKFAMKDITKVIKETILSRDQLACLCNLSIVAHDYTATQWALDIYNLLNQAELAVYKQNPTGIHYWTITRFGTAYLNDPFNIDLVNPFDAKIG